MIQPANRISEVKEYFFSRKLRQIAQMTAQGADVISLGIGGPDLPPPGDVIDTLTTGVRVPSNHGYQSHTGIPELRQAFAQWYANWYGVQLDAATEVQPLIGSKEGILHISLAFVNPGDGVLVPNPGYPAYTAISRMIGAEVFQYPLTEEGGWQPDFDAMERSFPLDRIKLMWLNYPHMPTGTAATHATFVRAVEFARRHNIVLVNDNPYSFILNKHPMSVFTVPGAKDVAIEMNSLSKSHNMAGWRMGVAVSNPTFISWILRVKSNIDSGQFRPVMLAAAQALQQPREWHDNLNAVYSGRRAVVERIMHALGCTFDPAQTGLFLWGRITDPAVSSEELADRVLSENHVFITPGTVFGPGGEGYIRLSLCCPVPRLEEALNRILNKKQK